jgi:hypothetical protein
MKMRCAGHVARMGIKNEYMILVRKPEGMRLLGRLKVGVKLNLREKGSGGMNRIVLAQDRDQWRVLANTVMNLPVPEMLRNS